MPVMPWQVKIAAKVVLSRLPIGYATWRRIRLFRHGQMREPGYAIEVFNRHVRASGFEPFQGFTALELGPGDSVASAVVAAAHGAGQVVLVDAGPFAERSMDPYRRLAAVLTASGLRPPRIEDSWTLSNLLEACRATYLTDGLASLRTLAPGSIDFIWSHAVLEHVIRDEFDATQVELRRIIRPSGIASHRVDLEDHLAGSLNSLRFSGRIWESGFMRRSGFYTNRLRASEVIASLERAGFDVRSTVDQWERLPITRGDLNPEFQGYADSDLLSRALDLIAIPRPARDSGAHG
jgi:hypothetical protein